MTDKELHDVRLIYETQIEHGNRVINLNRTHFRQLLELAERAARMEMMYENTGSIMNRRHQIDKIEKLEKILEKTKEMTLRQLMVNITNDCQEDADTGFSWELSIEEYLNNLLSY